jgi:hypothetical protein
VLGNHSSTFERACERFSRVTNLPQTQRRLAKRYKCQIIPIHFVAFYLLPKNRQLNFDSNYQTQLFNFFTRYAKTEAEAIILREEYCSYISQMGPFSTTNPCWKHQEDPVGFWLVASVSFHLDKLALRIFKAPCNSVPSEPAFSIQNLIHTKTRNQLRSEKVNKLTYIYINTRVLSNAVQSTRLSITKRSPHDLTEAELVQLEDELLASEGMSDMESIGRDSSED